MKLALTGLLLATSLLSSHAFAEWEIKLTIACDATGKTQEVARKLGIVFHEDAPDMTFDVADSLMKFKTIGKHTFLLVGNDQIPFGAEKSVVDHCATNGTRKIILTVYSNIGLNADSTPVSRCREPSPGVYVYDAADSLRVSDDDIEVGTFKNVHTAACTVPK